MQPNLFKIRIDLIMPLKRCMRNLKRAYLVGLINDDLRKRTKFEQWVYTIFGGVYVNK